MVKTVNIKQYKTIANPCSNPATVSKETIRKISTCAVGQGTLHKTCPH